MRPSIVMCALFAVAAEVASSSEILPAEILTPDAAIAKHVRASAKPKSSWPDDFTATVEATIIIARKQKYGAPDGKPHERFCLHPNGAPNLNFDFIITEKAVTSLKQAGIDDLEKHFVGKTITVRGVIETVEYNLISSPKQYVLGIDKLDQFIEVKSVEAK